VKLRQLDSPHVSDWQQRRLEAISGASVRRERNLLNNAFEIAVKEWKWLRRNPFFGVRRPRDGRPRSRVASDAEVRKLLESASPTMARVVEFALETGMRASEIAGLKTVKGQVAYLVDSKNGEAREVPLSPRAIELWQGGFGITAGSISAMFADLARQCGIKGLTFHDLRHTACTRLSKRLDLFQLCRMMGWKDPRHALIYYNETAGSIAARL